MWKGRKEMPALVIREYFLIHFFDSRSDYQGKYYLNNWRQSSFQKYLKTSLYNYDFVEIGLLNQYPPLDFGEFRSILIAQTVPINIARKEILGHNQLKHWATRSNYQKSFPKTYLPVFLNLNYKNYHYN